MTFQRFYYILFIALTIPFWVSRAEVIETGVNDGHPYKIEKISDGYVTPWGMAFVSPTQLLIGDRAGTLFLFDMTTNTQSTISGLPDIHAKAQGGLLDIKTPPNYAENGWVYFTYSKPTSFLRGGETALARAKLSGNKLTSWQDLLVTTSEKAKDKHFGSRIAFDKSGHVYFGIGDRGNRPNAQNTQNHSGSIIRLNLDGSIPGDNPFVANNRILDEIWSYGHRNPQGLYFDSIRNILWENEHGPRGGDEINIIKKGANYGWPKTSHGKEYFAPVAVGEAETLPGIESPMKVYIPSIAPGSLLVYQGHAFPNWRGDLFNGSLKLKHINQIAVNTSGNLINERRLLKDLNQRIRNIIEGPDGFIYFSTDSGGIYQISPV